jgi:hypothetical protein
MPPRHLRDDCTRPHCLGNDPTLLRSRPPPPAHNPTAHLAPKRLREFISVDHSDVHLAIQRQASPAYAALRNVGSDHRLPSRRTLRRSTTRRARRPAPVFAPHSPTESSPTTPSGSIWRSFGTITVHTYDETLAEYVYGSLSEAARRYNDIIEPQKPIHHREHLQL